MLMALFQNKESLSSNKTTRVCGQADKNVQLQARPRGLIGVRRKFNLLLHPIVIRRLTVSFLYDHHSRHPFKQIISVPDKIKIHCMTYRHNSIYSFYS